MKYLLDTNIWILMVENHQSTHAQIFRIADSFTPHSVPARCQELG